MQPGIQPPTAAHQVHVCVQGPDGDLNATAKSKSTLKRSGSRTGRKGSRGGKSRKHRRDRSADEKEVAVDPLTDLCPSCGNRGDLDHMYDVQYKTLVDHYEQLLLLLGLKPMKTPDAGGEGGGAVAAVPRESVWPPKSLVQSAAGGVGISGLYPDDSKRGGGSGSGGGGDGDGSRTSRLPTVGRIPPIIAKAHPKLSPADYRRYRRDPLFLYKTMTVCEDCFLVYATVASNMMQGMEPGSAVHRVMGTRAADVSRRRQVPLPVVEGARYSRLRARERAEQAQQAALRGDMSDLPPATRTVHEPPRTFYPSHTLPPAVPRRMPVQEMSGLTSTLRSSLTTGSMDELPHEVGAELASRQHAFYAQLSQNPNLHKGHPLSHMVSNEPGRRLPRAAPGTAPSLEGARSAPVLRGPQMPRDALTAPGMSERHMVAAASVGQFSTLPPGNRGGYFAPGATADGMAWDDGSMAKVEARGGATLRAYSSPPASASQLGGTKRRRRRRKKQRGRKGGGRDLPAEPFGTSATRHQDFLNKMSQDVKGRLDYPEPLLGTEAGEATRADGSPKRAPRPKKSRSKKQLKSGPSWRDLKAEREREANEAKEKERAEEAKARRKRQAAYKRRLKQRDAERKEKQGREQDAAQRAVRGSGSGSGRRGVLPQRSLTSLCVLLCAMVCYQAMRAEEERKAREHYKQSLRRANAAGSGAPLVGKDGKELRSRPQPSEPDPGARTEGRSDYRSLYEEAAAEAAADIAAIQGGAPQEDAAGLRCATPWKIGGLQTVVHAQLFPSTASVDEVGVPAGTPLVEVPDTVAVDVSAFYWQRPSTGTQPTPATAPPFKSSADSDAAPTHNPDNFTRGIMRLDVHDTASERHASVAIRICVYAMPPHPDGLPPPVAQPPIAAPLPHVVLLSRVLEACFFENPPADEDGGGGDGESLRMAVDSDFICADAVNPSGRHRPIMCHARKFGKDMVIVSLHTVEPTPGDGASGGGDGEGATSPRFVLQAYNYTKRKFIAANLTRAQLLKSDKPFLKQAAQVYFANLENRPMTPAGEASGAGAGGGDETGA